jgi:hypothetical protein
MQHLVDALGPRQIAQPHRVEVAQRHRLEEPPRHAVDDGLEQDHLAAMRRAHDAGAAIDGAAEIVVVAMLERPGVQPAAHAQRHTVGRCRVGKRESYISSVAVPASRGTVNAA